MRINPNFEIVNIVDDYILVPVGEEMTSFNGTVILNETSAFILDKIKMGHSIDELVHLLVEEYDVQPEIARKDIDELIDRMREAGVVDE